MKRILLSQREQTDRYGVRIDVLESTYIKYFAELGYMPITVSNFCKDVEAYFNISDIMGVVLTGGGAVPEEYYSDIYGYEQCCGRNRVEKELVEYARARQVPILGICHGMQFINGCLGGKVSRLVFPDSERKNGVDHPVIWDGQEFLVNNFHNDGVYTEDLAAELRPLAIDVEYGVVEAFASADMMVLGVQWHPERMFSDGKSREKTKTLVLDFLAGGKQR